MEIKKNNPPRMFNPLNDISLQDCGEIIFSENEQITISNNYGKSNDIICKDWGFYLGNSINYNLKKKGLKLSLVVSYASNPPRTYLNLVDISKIKKFEQYCIKYNAKVVCWLDDFFKI